MAACICVAIVVRREGATTSPGHWWNRCALPKAPDSGLSPHWGSCPDWSRKSGSDGKRLHEFWMGNRDRHRACLHKRTGPRLGRGEPAGRLDRATATLWRGVSGTFAVEAVGTGRVLSGAHPARQRRGAVVGDGRGGGPGPVLCPLLGMTDC